MKTIDEWNAEKEASYVPPPPMAFSFTPPKPKPLGAACPCGAELHDAPGTFWGYKPPSPGIQCLVCGQKGYISGWMGPEKIVLVES